MIEKEEPVLRESESSLDLIPLWENVWGGTRYEPMTVNRVYSDGGEKRKVGSVERIYRVHVDGKTKELIYAKAAADRPEIFGTIFDTILRSLVE